MSDYIQTVKSGLETLPWPKEREALFGEGDHFVTDYGSSSGAKEWNTEVFFAGRYTLTLQVDVDIDDRWNRLPVCSGRQLADRAWTGTVPRRRDATRDV